jgi:hypothetical protein
MGEALLCYLPGGHTNDDGRYYLFIYLDFGTKTERISGSTYRLGYSTPIIKCTFTSLWPVYQFIEHEEISFNRQGTPTLAFGRQPSEATPNGGNGWHKYLLNKAKTDFLKDIEKNHPRELALHFNINAFANWFYHGPNDNVNTADFPPIEGSSASLLLQSLSLFACDIGELVDHNGQNRPTSD